MSKTNKKKVGTNVNGFSTTEFTHEGAPARRTSVEQELRRSVLACMLWEDTFYESGESIADRISRNVDLLHNAEALSRLAIEARTNFNLRHVPLLIARQMAKNPEYRRAVETLLPAIIQRPDEIAEFMSIYWKDGKEPIAKAVKRGLADSFAKFTEYQLAKYRGEGNAISLKDVAFLVHACVPAEKGTVGFVPKIQKKDKKYGKVYARGNVVRHLESPITKLVNDVLPTPDTWEVLLTQAHTPEAKKAVWEKLLAEKKLGAMALLRNLRNMQMVGVNQEAIEQYFETVNTSRVLPFRFIAAAKYAVALEPAIEKCMLKNLDGVEKLKGKTVLLVDTSGSMSSAVSGKSDLRSIDAAVALAILLREICEKSEVVSFSNSPVLVPARHGFALRDAIGFNGGGTNLGMAVEYANKRGYDRIIVFTDEQSHDRVGDPLKGSKAYMINVASYQNGVGYGSWTHIDGFSEAVVDYIREYERITETSVDR